LACVRHAASVQSEPGSNSSVQTCYCFSVPLRTGRSLKITDERSAPSFSTQSNLPQLLLCETRLLSLFRQSEDHRAPPSSTHTYRLLIFKEHSREAPCFFASSATREANSEASNIRRQAKLENIFSHRDSPPERPKSEAVETE
ncbi:hypothetical protein, partial [Burkholderia sp. Ac-20365]|uniref:hypothetical protein n=1 Tax=Burkholderia sp. Ac-20365 TaxID=2703897 RepID=UPI00197BBAB5